MSVCIGVRLRLSATASARHDTDVQGAACHAQWGLLQSLVMWQHAGCICLTEALADAC